MWKEVMEQVILVELIGKVIDIVVAVVLFMLFILCIARGRRRRLIISIFVCLGCCIII